MQIIIDMCSVSYQVTIEYRFKSSPHKSPSITTLHMSAMSASLDFHHGLLLQQEKNLGFPTDDSIGKLLLRRMTSDY